MKGTTAALALLAAVLSGCASMSTTSQETTAQGECERSGAVWRVVLSYCEVQAGSLP